MYLFLVQDEHNAYIVQELCPGGDLKSLLEVRTCTFWSVDCIKLRSAIWGVLLHQNVAYCHSAQVN